MRIGEAVAAAELALAELRSLADSNPDLWLTRNQVGNHAIMWPDGDQLGYVDVFNGEVRYYEDPAQRPQD